MAEQTIGVRLLGDASSLGKAIDQANRKLGGLGGALQKAAKVGAVALAGGVVAAGAAILKFGNDFDQAFNAIEAGTGASGDALADLEQSFKDILRSGPDSMDRVAQATADLNTELGLTGDELEDAAEAALDASRAFDVDLGSTIKGVSDSLGLFEKDATDFRKQLDFIARVSQDTGVPIDSLSTTLQTFGPVLKNAGFSIEETTLLFGNLQGAGIDITRVMPALNANFRRLATEGVTDLKGALDDQIQSIANAETTTEALSIATAAFGAEGAQRMTTAIRNGMLPSTQDLVDTMMNAQGTVEQLGESSLTMGDKWSQIQNSLAVGLEPVITRVFTGLHDLINEKVLPAVDELSVWFEEHEEEIVAAMQAVGAAAQEAFGYFMAGLEIVWPPLKRFGEFLMDNKVAMVAALTAVGVAMVVAFGPVSAAVVAIVGIITLLGLVSEHWEEIKATVRDAIDAVVEKIDNLDGRLAILLSIIGGPIGVIVAAIKFRDELQMLGEKAVEIGTMIVDAFKAMAQPIQDAIDKVETLINKVKSIPTPDLPSLPSLPSFSLPGFDSGGVVPGPVGRPTLAVVHGGETILPTHRGGASGGTQIVIQVTQPLGTPQQIADAVAGHIRQLEKRGTITRITR